MGVLMSYRDSRISHSDLGYFPSNDETLTGYADRLKHIVSQMRQTVMPEHEKWWTHRRPNPCFICNMIDMLEYCIDSLVEVQQSDNKGNWRYKVDSNLDHIGLHRTVRKH